MPSVKALLGDAIGRLIFHPLTVERVRRVTMHFRRLTLVGDPLRGAAYNPGDKLQIMISGVGPRTWTPFTHDPARGAIDILAYHHGGDAPGADWAQSAAQGDPVRVFGPRGSLPFASLTGPVVLFGDETSFAAARALRDVHPDAGLVFEATDRDEADTVLGDLALSAHTVVERRPDDAHRPDLHQHLRDLLARRPDATVVLTGNAQSILAARADLRAHKAAHAAQKVKAYWAPGKRGLD
jgi:NADPH-dependent ferric siderophore reductase